MNKYQIEVWLNGSLTIMLKVECASERDLDAVVHGLQLHYGDRAVLRVCEVGMVLRPIRV